MQRSFDDLGTPLADVTFCVVDVETTGASAATDAITEIGAVKVRGGQCLGTFATLVNPGRAIPPHITVLTGITDAMVAPAPRVHEVLPAFVEFAAGTVLVGHNVRFDRSFLDAALVAAGWPRLPHPAVDTCALARRLLADEVPNHRLATLASRLRLDHRPCHRALDDALATADLLHALLERAAAFGVLGLDDLLGLPRLTGHPQAAKLRLTTTLPRRPGVYLFTGAGGEVLYVGKATDLRQRVRSYFSGDTRRKVPGLLRELQGVHALPCASTLEAAVAEARLIRHHRPRYNRVGNRPERAAYLKLTLGEAFPRLSVVRAPRPGDGLYVGPLPSAAAARTVGEAVLGAAPLRRCSTPLGPRTPRRDSPCTPAQLGVAPCPCAGVVDPDGYRATVAQVVRGLTEAPEVLLDRLGERLAALAAQQRYEEAADVRDRAAALAAALTRQRRLDALRRAGTLRLALPGGRRVELCRGVLVGAWGGVADGTAPLPPPPAPPEPSGPLPVDVAGELAVVAAWLDTHAAEVRVEHCDAGLAWPATALPRFQPPDRAGRARR